MRLAGRPLRALGLAGSLLFWCGFGVAAPPAARTPPVQFGSALAEDPLAAPLVAGPGEEEVVRRAFQRFDADGDGRLSRNERLRYVRDPSELALDADGDGSLAFGEFLEAFLTQRHPRKLSTASYLQSLLRRGRELAVAGWTELALECYQEASRDYPDCAEAPLGKARCLEVLGRSREALRACEKALAIDPSLTEGWLSLALLAARSGDRVAGKRAASVALARLEDSRSVAGEAGEIAARQLLGLLRALRKELLTLGLPVTWLELLEAQASSRLRTARERTSGSTQDPVWQVAGLAASGHLVGALEASEAASRTGKDGWQLWLLRACLEGALGSPDAAAASLGEATRRGAESWLLASVGLGNRLDRGERAQAVRELAELSARPSRPWQVLEVGWQLAYRGEWGLALPWLERAHGRWGASEELRVLLALCHKRAGHDLQAVRLLEPLASPPLLGPQWLELAAELLDDLGHPARAMVAVREAVRQQPALVSARLKFARLLHRSGLETDCSNLLTTGLLLCPATDPLWPELAAAWLERLPWLLADRFTTLAGESSHRALLIYCFRVPSHGGMIGRGTPAFSPASSLQPPASERAKPAPGDIMGLQTTVGGNLQTPSPSPSPAPASRSGPPR
jgi:tetratricopeptide (TPR) repeat protein